VTGLRQWLAGLLTAGGSKSAVVRGGPGFCGILDANAADIPDILRFEMPIYRNHETIYRFDFPVAANENDVGARYRHLILSPEGGAAIYVADGRAAGYVAWMCYHSHRTRHAAVLSIAVEPALRGNGIGRALLDHLRDRLTAEGVVALRAHVWAHNTESRDFFEASGFAPVHTVYSLGLDE
jgi:L-amino acid N-acyltransferase YncA